jgi:hypothetical protein
MRTVLSLMVAEQAGASRASGPALWDMAIATAKAVDSGAPANSAQFLASLERFVESLLGTAADVPSFSCGSSVVAESLRQINGHLGQVEAGQRSRRGAG